jgi:apolipoprotein N-acyltransferase
LLPHDHTTGRSTRASLRAWSPATRWPAALALATSRASLPVIGVAAVTVAPALLEPPVLAPLLALVALAPGLTAWALRRAAEARADVVGGELHVARRGSRVEAPLGSIATLAPWRVPLPGVGFDVRLRSGRRLPVAIESRDPGALLERLTGAGVAAAGAAARHPALVFARARSQAPGGWLRHPLLKFVVFSLLPTAVLFRAHQHIAYGASFGQVYLEGLRPFLVNLAFYWAVVSAYVLLWASAWRALAEAAAWLAACIAPSHAARVRRFGEWTCLAAVYAGVPALLAARFLA